MDSEFDVVISGISGVFPSSANFKELAKNLYNQKTLLEINESKWPIDNEFNIIPAVGTVPVGIGVFDATFFTYNSRLSQVTNPMTKLAVERSFEAIIDAGIPPQSLKGSNTQVYTTYGVSIDESLLAFANDEHTLNYVMMGQARTMCANRISYYLDLKGKSLTLDASWTSTETALQIATADILRGESDAALIVAGNIVELPQFSTMYRNFGLISKDGTCRSFDQNASGGQLSDVCICLFLQRSDQAKRIYAHVAESRAELLAGPRMNLGIAMALPTSAMAEYISKIYSDCGKDPRNVLYLEADGSGCKAREESELNGADAVLGKGRTKEHPLLVGSVKSIVGSMSNASGFMAIAKILTAIENDSIPGNINFEEPNLHIKPLAEGSLKVVDRNTPINMDKNSLFASTTLGLAGTVGHTVLKPNLKEKASVNRSQELPRLVVAYGRTQAGTESVLSQIETLPFDPEFVRLTHEVFTDSFRMMNFHGYTVLPKSDLVPTIVKELPKKQSLWFVYSGMGSQWGGMGLELMQFPIFSETIERLHNILSEKNLDLKTIITETGPEAFDTVLKSFVGITAIQIALTNLLKALEIQPDGIIGHSLGEIGCAYADGCLTEEQTILVAWARGRASTDAKLIHGMMAAIGLGYNEIKDILPPAIDVACHNSSTSCTISGPKDDVETFVKKLTEDKVFARIVSSGEIAFHSRYIEPAGTLLHQYLQEVIPSPKPRSSQWLSSSVSQAQWDTPEAKVCSAHYQTNNLLNPVLFEEVLTVVPSDAMLVEIAPHGLMQAILKRALPENVHISLTRRSAKSPVHFFLEAIGQLYVNGVNPKVSALYPEVEFPVSRGTPSLSNLTSWNHTEAETIKANYTRATMQLIISQDDPWIKIGDAFFASPAVMLNIARISKVMFMKGAAFTFKDIRIHKKLCIPDENDCQLFAFNSDVSGGIEILDEDDNVILTGRALEHDFKKLKKVIQEPKNNTKYISGDYMYKAFIASGIEYSPQCKGVKGIYIDGHVWTIAMTSTLGLRTYLDSLIQICQYANLQKMLPYQYLKHILRLEVDPKEILKTDDVLVQYNTHSGTIDGPGIHIEGVELEAIQNEKYTDCALPQLNKMKVIKYGLNPLDGTFSITEQVGVGQLDYTGIDHNNQRVMGIACRTRDSNLLQLDPILKWSVPPSWTDDDATSVPFAYCAAIYALEVCSRIQERDSVMIHGGMSAIGQAALRIALQYNCDLIIMTVTSEQEKRALLNNFPQLNHNNIIDTSTESFEKKVLLENKKTRIVLNNLPGEGLRASLRCLARKNARVVHYGRKDMLHRNHIGMWPFCYNDLALYGLTGDFLLRARSDHRQTIIKSMANGLKSGWICPIIGCKTYESPSSPILRSLKSDTKSVLNNYHAEGKYTRDCVPNKSYLVIGGTVIEWMEVVGNLAKFGAKNVVVSSATEDEYAGLISQRLSVLKDNFGTTVEVLSDISTLKNRRESNFAASIDAMILIVKSQSASTILSNNLVNSKHRVFVLLTSASQNPQPFIQLCQQKREDGLQAAVVQGPLSVFSSLIRSFLADSLPPYIGLFKHSVNKETPEGVSLTLPSSVNDVCKIADSLPNKPRIRELPIHGLRLRHCHEVFPIFVLPPLGVLQPSEKDALWSFASKQHQPVILIELPEGGTILDRSKIVVNEIHRLRPAGPYNILGWTLSTPLALQVTRDIEANGQRAVTFLIDGDVQNIKNWTTKKSESSLLLDIFKQEIPTLSLEKLESASSWPECISILLSTLDPLQSSKKDKILKGLNYLASYFKEISQHIPNTQQPFEGHMHVLRRSAMEPICFSYAHVSISTITPFALDSHRIATLINKEAAVSSQASEDDMRILVSEASK